MGAILPLAEYGAIRAVLQVQEYTLPDETLDEITLVPGAELIIGREVAKQTVNGVPSVALIIAGTAPATATDLTALKAAVAYYTAYLCTFGETNMVNVAAEVGSVSADFGGIGDEWTKQGQYYLSQSAFFLSLLTGWKDDPLEALQVSGPTSSGASPDTVSGFWLASR